MLNKETNFVGYWLCVKCSVITLTHAWMHNTYMHSVFTSTSPTVTEKISSSFNNLMSCPAFSLDTRPFDSWPNTSGDFLSCPSPTTLETWSHGLKFPFEVNSHTWAYTYLAPLPRMHLLPFLYEPDIGKDWGQEEKGVTEDEMIGWHHGLNRHEFEWTPGGSRRQGSLACCCPWGHRELDRTWRLNNNSPKCDATGRCLLLREGLLSLTPTTILCPWSPSLLSSSTAFCSRHFVEHLLCSGHNFRHGG